MRFPKYLGWDAFWSAKITQDFIDRYALKSAKTINNQCKILASFVHDILSLSVRIQTHFSTSIWVVVNRIHLRRDSIVTSNARSSLKKKLSYEEACVEGKCFSKEQQTQLMRKCSSRLAELGMFIRLFTADKIQKP